MKFTSSDPFVVLRTSLSSDGGVGEDLLEPQRRFGKRNTAGRSESLI